MEKIRTVLDHFSDKNGKNCLKLFKEPKIIQFWFYISNFDIFII